MTYGGAGGIIASHISAWNIVAALKFGDSVNYGCGIEPHCHFQSVVKLFRPVEAELSTCINHAAVITEQLSHTSAGGNRGKKDDIVGCTVIKVQVSRELIV